MSTDVTQLVHTLMAAWNRHEAEQIVALHAPDFSGVDVARASIIDGREQFGRGVRRFLAAFPDLHFEYDPLVEGQRAAIIWTLRATHRGELMRVPPTGRPVELYGTSLLAFEEGLISSGRYIWDTGGFLRGVGLLPEL